MINYPIRFFNTNIPTNKCNLRCHYCYVGQTYSFNNENLDKELEYSFDHMRKCLSKSRLGGVCMFNLCAPGETMLYKQLPEIVQMFLELGHYVSIVTNLVVDKTLDRIVEIAGSNRDRLFVKCSFHYLELNRLGLVDVFVANVNKLKDASISFTVELTANDESIKHIPDIKQLCISRLGAFPHIVESRNERDENFPRLTQLLISEHQLAWQGLSSPLFNYQQKHYEKYIPDFCLAGDVSLCLDIASGIVSKCEGAKQLSNIYDNPDEDYVFSGIGANCPTPHCFINYVHSALCGCFSDDAPTYAEERDRVCADGSHWLTPVMREVFSHRMSEWHTPYSEDKKLFIDTLMRWNYRKISPTDDEKLRLADIFKGTLSDIKIGLVLAPPYLAELLKPFTRFTIDREPEESSPSLKQKLKCLFRYLHKKLLRRRESLGFFDNLPKTDMIIICDYEHYNKHSKRLAGKKTVNILELVK